MATSPGGKCHVFKFFSFNQELVPYILHLIFFFFSNQKLLFQNIQVCQESTPHEKLNLVVMRLIILLIKQYIMSILSSFFLNLGSFLINGNFNGVSGVKNRYETK